MREFLKHNLTPLQIKKVKNWVHFIQSFGKTSDLNKLGVIYETDKYGEHMYTPHYQFHFQAYRNLAINLLEIGVGGYDNPLKGGNSLRMWKRYFTKAQLVGLDIFDKTALSEPRITIYKGSQTDTHLLDQIIGETNGGFDIIIDDGSHINEHVIQTFEHLFPQLNQGGYYVIEDTQTSYWKEYGGSNIEFRDGKTMVSYFQNLVHGLNHTEFLIDNYQPSYTDLNIVSIHFYHNLIFIKKGLNNEPSNYCASIKK